jgi:hypothetical protein
MYFPWLRRKFRRQGYLIINPGVPVQLLDDILTDLNSGPSAETYRDGYRVQDAWGYHASIRTLATAPRVIRILQKLYGRQPLPFQTLNFRMGTQQKVHSDTIHFNSIPSGFMCGVWVALEDIDMDNGPLVFYPGSHRLPEYTLTDVGVEAAVENYGHYEHFVQELIARHRLRPRYATLKKGQALIWSANLLHGGAPQKDLRRTRHSQVTHVYFEGCQYYTPLTSQGKQISWRQPNFLPVPPLPPLKERMRESLRPWVPKWMRPYQVRQLFRRKSA